MKISWFFTFFPKKQLTQVIHPQKKRPFAARPHFGRGEATRLWKRFNEAKQLVEGLGEWTEHSEHPRLLKSAWANIPPGKDRWLATPISLGLSWPRKLIATFWEWLAICFHNSVFFLVGCKVGNIPGRERRMVNGWEEDKTKIKKKQCKVMEDEWKMNSYNSEAKRV